jgi:N-acetyl-anhydromuramyl-L-alanine amidase AmpD
MPQFESDGIQPDLARIAVSLEAAKDGTLVLWTKDYPEGPRFQWTVAFAEFEPVDSVKGVQQRLRNLGYEVDVSGEMDGRTHTALLDFKHVNEIEHGDELVCAKTKAKLADS